MPVIRRRQSTHQGQHAGSANASPAPRQRRRRAPSESDEDAAAESQGLEDVDMEDDDGEEHDASQEQIVKSLVRLALASEHSRTPLRRSDITAKVLNGRSRQFKHVFNAAQLALRTTFGMDLVELPAKERVTLTQRRAAQKATSQGTQSNSANKSWILVSILPSEYRDSDIVPPSKAPNEETEAAYTGLYSLTVALIALYGAPMPEARLERAFARMNASETTPVDRYEKLLERMARNGYIVKIKDTAGGEETVEYLVGPRGKREIGSDGIAGLVRSVYGHSDDGSEATAELEKKLEASLKVAGVDVEESNGTTAAARATKASGRPAARRGRPPRNRPRADEEAEGE